MKKVIYFAVMVTVLASCQKGTKDIAMTLPNKIDVKVANGHLQFLSSSDYGRFLELPQSEQKKLVSNLPNRGSFRSFISQPRTNATGRLTTCQVPDELLEDNANFFALLDANGVLQIDSMLYKYDYCSDKAYVMKADDTTDANAYTKFLANEELTGLVGAFPTYVDAIAAVEEGYKTMPDTSTV